ncbi:MAG: potassium channel family protein [Desulfocapsa sp.]|nr:potassium channel family protein [Desulfocapsa sp.]
MSEVSKKVFFLLSGFILILFGGTFGYMFLEEYEFTDALYLTIITVATVGYGDMVPHHPGGKILTVVLVLVGVSFVMYMFSRIVEAMVEGGLREILGKRQMKKQLEHLKNHYIVCGHGRIGSVICQTLQDNGKPFVVIDNDEKEIQDIMEKGYVTIKGEAAQDDVLIEAGIKRAIALITVVSTDADNVFITLTAKGINPDIIVLARSSGELGSETKLKRAGADKAISPYFIGGRRMAQSMLRPNVTDFIDLAMYTRDMSLRLDEILVTEKAPIHEKTLQQSNLRKKYDASSDKSVGDFRNW